MRGNHKHMPFQILQLICHCVPSLVQITSMNPVKLLLSADNICTMALKKAIYIHIRANIDRIPQKLREHWAYQLFPIKLHPFFRIVSGNIPIRGIRFLIHLKDFPHDCRLLWLLHQLLRMDSLHHDLLKAISIRRLSTHAKPLLTSGIISITDTLLYRFSLKLCKHNTDIQHCTPHRCGSVKLLCRRDKFYLILLKQLHHI